MKLFKDFTARLNTKLHGKLASGSFAHNVLMMFIGTAIGQLGGVLLSPVLTRIYSPEQFGVLGMYMAVISILSLIATLRYEIAIPLVKTDEEAANMLAVCGISLVFTSIIISLLLLFITAVPDCLQSSVGELWAYRAMIPIGVFAIGAYQVGVYYATHKQSFKALSQTKVYQGYGGPISQIILGLLGANVWGLIIGFVIGQSMGLSMLFKRLIGSPSELIKAISMNNIKALAWRFRNFPLVSSFAALISTLGGENILLIAIPIIYNSTTVTGFIFLINRIVGRPLLMISTSILQVYLGDVSKTRNSDPKAMRKRFLNMVSFQFLIVSSWLFIINISAKYIIPLAFGAKWTDCVPYIYVLSIAYLPQMTMHAVIHTLQVLEKQKLSAIWDISRLIAVMGGFFYSFMFDLEVMQALILYSVIQAISHIVLFLLMYKSIQDLQLETVSK